MSRRLPTSPLVVLFALLSAGVLAPLLAPSAAGFGERAYDANQVINGTNHFDVYAGQSVAQSFVATASYFLLNATLRLRNVGDTTDALNVTIRADSMGSPANGYLAASETVVGTNALGNYNVNFANPAALTRGERYWIVATSAALVGNEYEWHHSASDAYAGGQAKVNIGTGWIDPASPTDMYFVTYGREIESNLTTSIVAATTDPDPGGFVTFRVYLNNSGTRTAQRAWLNDTLLPGFTYVSDDAAAAGSSTPYPAFTFTNVANGPRSFDLVVRVNIGTEPGTVLSKALSLVYVDSSGTLRTAPTAQASVLVGPETKPLYLTPESVETSERLSPSKPTRLTEMTELLRKDGSVHPFDLSPVLSRNFRVIGANATLYLNSENNQAKDLVVNLTLTDWNGVTLIPIGYVQRVVRTNAFNDFEPFTFAFPAIDHTFPEAGRIRLTVRILGTSEVDAVLAMNSTFAASRVELRTTSYVRIDDLSLRDAAGPATVWSPMDSLVVRANVSDPYGSATVMEARISLTSPSGALVVNRTQMTLIGTDASNPSAWKLFEFLYGPPLAEGVYRVSVTAEESNGIVDIAEATALVRAPVFSLAKTSTMLNVRSGDRFTYDIWFNNTGTGPAGFVWVNDSLPGELTFVGSSDPGAMTGNYNWTWANVGPGNYRLRIDVQVKGSLPPVPYVRNIVTLEYADEKGFRWPAKSAFVDVAIRGPVISFAKDSTRTTIHANEEITYRFTLQNSGDPASKVWVNDTLPSGSSYVSDTASSLGGTTLVSGNNVYFEFGSMGSLTTWSFTLTARTAPGLPRGPALVNRAYLNYTNSNGFLMPTKNASWSAAIVAPEIVSAAVGIERATALPSDIVAVVVSFANQGNEPARDLWLNLTMDRYLGLVNASAPATVFPTATATEVRFILSNVGIGSKRVSMNVSVDPQVADRRLLTVSGTIAYTDGVRNQMPLATLVPDALEASAPSMALSVTPGSVRVEAGTRAYFNIYQVNAGSGVAGDVWLTLPLPAGFDYENDTSGLSGAQFTIIGTIYVWHWQAFSPGAKSFVLQLVARPGVTNGTGESLAFRTEYTDVNGNFRMGVSYTVNATFVAPQIEMALQMDPREVPAGETVTYTLTLLNVGGTTARNLWLTSEIDARFEIVSSSSRVRVVREPGSNVLNWSYPDFAPSQVETVVLILRIRDGTPARSLIPTVFEATYTNSMGYVIRLARSDTVPALVIASAAALYYVGLGALFAGLTSLYLLHRSRRVQIEEVFLVYRDGVLISHLSRSLTANKDEDVLSGMLTAVQEFVRDAFVYGEHRELHHLDFGEYRIMIERGRNVYLAVVFSGSGSSSVRRKIRAALDRIETAYATVLDKWDGDMDKVVGTRELIRDYLLRPNGRGRRGKPRAT